MDAFQTLEKQGGPAAVLFVHGIQGCPRQFQWLMDALPPDTAYLNLLLPGHGAGLSAFRRSGRREWQAAVDGAARELRKSHDRVLFVGHSMGCLLGLQALRNADISCDSMLLLNCPLVIRPTLRYFRYAFLASAPGHQEDPFVQAARAANSVRTSSPLLYLTCLHPYLELFRLIRQVRRAPRRPDLPVTAVFSLRDEIVHPAAREIARRDFGFTVFDASSSGHNYFAPADQRLIANLLRGAVDQGKG